MKFCNINTITIRFTLKIINRTDSKLNKHKNNTLTPLGGQNRYKKKQNKGQFHDHELRGSNNNKPQV